MINQGRVRTIPPRVYVLVLISVLLLCSSPSGGSYPRDHGRGGIIVGLYFYPVGNWPQWGVVLEPTYDIILLTSLFLRDYTEPN